MIPYGRQSLDQADVDMVMGPAAVPREVVPAGTTAIEEIVAVEVPEVSPEPRGAAQAALEPIMALSAEEKIALFT